MDEVTMRLECLRIAVDLVKAGKVDEDVLFVAGRLYQFLITGSTK